MKQQSAIKAIIFDMDGVLVDMKDWHYESLNHALGLFGFHISRHAHRACYDGLPTRRKLEKLSADSGLPRELHGFINEMKQIYTLDMLHALCRPRFAHEYAFSQLKAGGMRLAVASNSVRETIDAMMRKARLSPYLDATFSNQDVACVKPNVEIYRRAIAHFDLAPEQCLIVVNKESGVQAALACGAHVMEVREVHETNLDNILTHIARIDALLVRRIEAVPDTRVPARALATCP